MTLSLNPRSPPHDGSSLCWCVHQRRLEFSTEACGVLSPHKSDEVVAESARLAATHVQDALVQG